MRSTKSRARSGAHCDLVLHRLDPADTARDGFRRALFGGVLGEARQHDGTVQGLDADRRRIDVFVLYEATLDSGGDGRVVNVGARGFLTARDCSPGCCDCSNGHHGSDESGANDHGDPPVRVDLYLSQEIRMTEHSLIL